MDCLLIRPYQSIQCTNSLSRFFNIKPAGSNLSINPMYHYQRSSSVVLPPIHRKTKIQCLSQSQPNPSPSHKNSIITSQFFRKSIITVITVPIFIFGCTMYLFGRQFSQLWSNLPSNPEIVMEMVMPLLEEVDKNDEEEKKHLKKLEKNPRHVDALRSVVSRKMVEGKTEEALEYVMKLIEIEPNEVEWRIMQAFTYRMTGQLDEAKKLSKDILEGNPTSLRLLHGLAMVMHKNQENSSVFQMLNKALEVARSENRLDDERNIRILIAQMHLLKGYTKKGSELYLDLVRENPQDFRPHLFQMLHASRVTNWTSCDDYIINFLLSLFLETKVGW